MVATGAPALLHIVGYLTGATLYAMLLTMVVRTRGPAYRLTVGTAVLGLAWNVGELGTQGFERAGLGRAGDWTAAVLYGALGLLAAVAVHSAGRGQAKDEGAPHPGPRLVVLAGYACATVAALMQLAGAAGNRPLPSTAALMLVTVGLGVLSPILLVATRHQDSGRRPLWIAGLGFFAVSALHLGRFHGASESWPTELLGHQASIPLAFAILYQDYRFAFADLFLKRALTLLVLVTVVFVGWSAIAPSLAITSDGAVVVAALLGMWVGTALLFPIMRRMVSAFVDRVVLKRANYARLLDEMTSLLQRCDSEEAVLNETCSALRPALGADAVTWRTAPAPVVSGPDEIAVVTTEDPQHLVGVGRMAGGRRLLSDDIVVLERIALLAGRRIDALRLSNERYERMLREREISTLAAESELRALRAQINPHFLFNALTTLGYLIQNAPGRALDTLMRLTTLLRSVLRSEGEFTTLGHEKELIECYLQIERERFEERLDARIDIPDSLSGLAIPSLIVQPLVENAIKHGIARARGGGRVVVRAAVEANGAASSLHILVSNTGAPWHGPVSSPSSGIGLQNVTRRLHCYYGEAATLTLTGTDTGETIAELTLPMSEAGDDQAPAILEHVPR